MNPVEDLLKSIYVMSSMVAPYTGGHLWRVFQFCRFIVPPGGRGGLSRWLTGAFRG